MSRAKSFDQDAVLNQAVELFWERGYDGTSLADLEAHLGLGRQSLYNTFGDKQALFLKALERYRREASQGPIAHLAAPGAGFAAIRKYFTATVDALTATEHRRSCLLVNTMLERGSQDAEALLRCNVARADLERSLRRALGQARGRGEVAKDLDVEATATLLVVQGYGLAVLSKSGASAADLHAAVEALLARLE
jgi:TetR/AcrR family transcriptional repressor of nem operon